MANGAKSKRPRVDEMAQALNKFTKAQKTAQEKHPLKDSSVPEIAALIVGQLLDPLEDVTGEPIAADTRSEYVLEALQVHPSPDPGFP